MRRSCQFVEAKPTEAESSGQRSSNPRHNPYLQQGLNSNPEYINTQQDLTGGLENPDSQGYASCEWDVADSLRNYHLTKSRALLSCFSQDYEYS